jgi:hypothetical protein
MACRYQLAGLRNSTLVPSLQLGGRPASRSLLLGRFSLFPDNFQKSRFAFYSSREKKIKSAVPRGLAFVGYCRSLDISAIKFARSSSRTAVNFNPMPRPSSACRTVASARICPSCTRKCRFVGTPISFGLGVSINTPPTLKSCTRATSSRPSQRQNTQTCCGVSTRVLSLREGEVV